MGIQTFVKKRREKKEFEKAVEKGKELQAGGKVLVPTTKGFVEVSKDSPLAKAARRGGAATTPSGAPGAPTISVAEIAKQKRIIEQRRQADLTKKRIEREREQIEKIRKMTAAQKRDFFRKQRSIIKGQALLRIQDAGKKLSKKGQEIAEREFQRQAKFRRQIVPRVSALITKQQKDFLSKLKSKSFNVADIALGGILTERKISNKQKELNEQVKKFNEQFGNRELTQEEFNRASKSSGILERNQEEIEKALSKFEKSKRKKFGKLFFGESEIDISDFGLQIKKEQKVLSEINSKLKKIKNKKNPLSTLNRKRLNVLKKGKVDAISQLEQGKNPYKISASDVPIIPIGTATALTRIDKIKFLGSQKIRGNKIITDLVFTAKKGGRVGIARGVTLQKGKEGFTVVSGKSGRLGFKFPSRKAKIKRLRSFVGAEKSVSRPTDFIRKSVIELNKGKGKVNLIEKNVEGMIQLSRGLVGQVKGKKFLRAGIKFPFGKLFKKRVRGVSFDNFASIASVFTKNDVSKIIGKTITIKGNKANFIGFIKGESRLPDVAKISGSLKQQYTEALKKVISTVASAEAQSKSITGATTSRLTANAVTANIVKKSLKNIKTSRPTQNQINKSIQRTVQQVPLSKVKQKVKTGLRVSQRLKTKVRTKTKQKQVQKISPISKQTLKQKQAQKVKLKQKQIARQRLRLKAPTIPVVSKGALKAIRLFRRKRKKVIIKKKPSKVPTFNVLGKSGKRFVRLNAKPLTRNDALSKGAFAIDNTTAKTFKIVPAGRLKKVGKLLKSERNYFKRAGFKLREFKVRKGRKFALKRKYIEKRKFTIDTRGEKKGLSLARFLKRRRGGRSIKRKISPSQRKVMLKNLAKARRAKRK